MRTRLVCLVPHNSLRPGRRKDTRLEMARLDTEKRRMVLSDPTDRVIPVEQSRR